MCSAFVITTRSVFPPACRWGFDCCERHRFRRFSEPIVDRSRLRRCNVAVCAPIWVFRQKKLKSRPSASGGRAGRSAELKEIRGASRAKNALLGLECSASTAESEKATERKRWLTNRNEQTKDPGDGRLAVR